VVLISPMSQQPPSDHPVDAGRKQDGPQRRSNGTYAKGQSGNPAGRAKGVRTKATQAAEAMLCKAADVKAISAVILREARAGQAWAVKVWASVVVPAPRGRLVSFRLPRIEGPSDIPGALLAVAGQVAEGTLTPTEASEIASVLDALRASYELDEIHEKVAELQAQVALMAPAAVH
jgi:hypothetical protein